MTLQATDSILYEGVPCQLVGEIGLCQNPRIVTVSDEEARASCSVFMTTACWRDFVAQWEIRENRMFLVGIAGRYRLENGEPMPADWVSGSFEVREDEVITDFWDPDYNGGLPREFVVQVQRGIVAASSYVPRARNAA